MNDLDQLKYPIGKFSFPKDITDEQVNGWISHIAAFPALIAQLTDKLTPEEKSWRYRPEGWNIKQLVHHCADSHMNSYIRFKLTLTEEKPVIKPYFEARWAALAESQDDDITGSLALIGALHGKWVKIMRQLSDQQLKLVYVHPEFNREYSLAENIALYAWHGNHHLAHIKQAMAAKGSYN